MNIVERPGSLAEVRRERVSKIVVLHDVQHMRHPALEAAIEESAESGYSVDAIAANFGEGESA